MRPWADMPVNELISDHNIWVVVLQIKKVKLRRRMTFVIKNPGSRQLWKFVVRALGIPVFLEARSIVWF